ncbi:uncharacterized protein [Diabrotica undecimpunctata]|uniref:uncharacterized protein n=1 Tax=Diabrotica undecimpunctata TaxID=50387 RepID=UPI003B63512B
MRLILKKILNNNGYSEDSDSIADRDYLYNEGSSDSSEDELGVSDVENEAAEAVPFTDNIPQTRWKPVVRYILKFNFLYAYTDVPEHIIQKLHGTSPISYFEHLSHCLWKKQIDLLHKEILRMKLPQQETELQDLINGLTLIVQRCASF